LIQSITSGTVANHCKAVPHRAITVLHDKAIHRHKQCVRNITKRDYRLRQLSPMSIFQSHLLLLHRRAELRCQQESLV
jgi:hypothetical protein